MDGVSAAASVVSIIELAAKTASLCLKYAIAVKNADHDIFRLHNELKSLEEVLQHVDQETNKRNDMLLVPVVYRAFEECHSRLSNLEKRLSIAKSHGTKFILLRHRLKWPLERKEVDRFIAEIERYKSTLSLALQLHQVTRVRDLENEIALHKLPYAQEALFDSYSSEQNATCHEKTRLNVRQDIRDWFHETRDVPIIWLNGMAGTGKSTISQSIAEEFASSGLLGATFFFKSHAGDRSSASKFFGTLSTQLAQHEAASVFGQRVLTKIQHDPHLGSANLERQFDEFLEHPFNSIDEHCKPLDKALRKSLLVIIDALDECESEFNVMSILRLFGDPELKMYNDEAKLRIMITSRPEEHIRRVFGQFPVGCYKELTLDQIAKPVVEHDIEVYMADELSKVINDWPDKARFEKLQNLAGSLFIVAATICRFIGDTRWDPDDQLQAILEGQDIGQTNHYARIYKPVLDRLLTDLPEIQEARLLKEFRDVIGPVVVLADSLSVDGLSELLDIPQAFLHRKLSSLHSIFKVPLDSNSSIELLHQTLRDFLTDGARKCEKFWIDERETHNVLAEKCLTLLMTTDALTEDICKIGKPAVSRKDIPANVIAQYLTPALQYACKFWIRHLWHAGHKIYNDSPCSDFLETRLLFWFEALSLLDCAYEVKTMLVMLEQLIESTNASKMRTLLSDSRTFISAIQDMLDMAPLQLYSSALVFTPKSNTIRQLYANLIPEWTKHLPAVHDTWSGISYEMGTHEDKIESMALSPNAYHLATGSRDGTIKLWNLSRACLEYSFEEGIYYIHSLLFTPNSELLVSSMMFRNIKIWNCTTGDLLFTIYATHKNRIHEIALSLDSRYLASCAEHDPCIKLWDLKTGMLYKSFAEDEAKDLSPSTIKFLGDDKTLACSFSGNMVFLFDIAGVIPQQTLKLSEPGLGKEFVSFSPNNKLLAISSPNEPIRVYQVDTMELLHIFDKSSQTYLKFSPDNKLLASNSDTLGVIRIWDIKNGILLHEVEDYSEKNNPIAFTGDSLQILARSANGTIHLQNLDSGTIQKSFLHPAKIDFIILLPDGKQLLSLCNDRCVRCWDLESGELKYTMKIGASVMDRLQFSTQGTCLLSRSYRENTIKVWDSSTGDLKYTLSGAVNYGTRLGSSVDDTILWRGEREKIYIWQADSRRLLKEKSMDPGSQLIHGSDPDTIAWMTRSGVINSYNLVTGNHHTASINEENWKTLNFVDEPVFFTATSTNRTRQVAVKHFFEMCIHLWCTETGNLLHKLPDEAYAKRSYGPPDMAYSVKGDRLLSFRGSKLLLWDTVSGALLLTLDCLKSAYTRGYARRSKCLARFSTNDEMFAVYEADTETLKVWTTIDGALIRGIQLERAIISRLVFSDDMRFLETNRGQIEINLDQSQRQPGEEPKAIFISDHWIHLGMEKILWLPAPYRPVELDYRDHKLALGHASGRVLIFDTTTDQESQIKPFLINGLEYPDTGAD